MTTKVYAHSGAEARSIELADGVFKVRVSNAVIHDAIRQELANRRVGTAATKGRGEVHGSNRKPWRQKGTGRARAGQTRSPLWIGGGTIFGPQPRSYEMHMPRKSKQLAMRSILTLKTVQARLRVVEDIRIESGKTRDLVKLLKNFGEPERTVMIVGSDDAMLRRAARNVPWLSVLSFKRLHAHTLFYGKRILVEESAAKALGTFYGASEGDGQ